MTMAALFAALLSVSSQIYIPGPVPHTLQIMVVLMAGAVLGARWGAISVVVWIMLGAFGLPVFAQGKAGLGVLAGPTGGFIISFAICAWIIGKLTERVLAIVPMILIMVGGIVIIYSIGIIGFMASFALFLQKPMTWGTAFTVAVMPFIPFDIIKAIAAAFIVVRVRSALRAIGFSVRK